jgi:ankyrin repeat protein
MRAAVFVCLFYLTGTGGARLGLHKAAQEGQIEPLKVAIAGRYDAYEDEWRKPDIDGQNKKGQTPLSLAVCNRRADVEVVRVIFDKGGANANARDSHGETALHAVSRLCNQAEQGFTISMALSMAKALLSHGADPSAPIASDSALTPLHIAAAGGARRSLLDPHRLRLGGSVTARLGGSARPALPRLRSDARCAPYLRSCAGHWQLVQLLLRKGANVDAADGDGATPLHHAARALSPKAVHALLAGGADAQRADASGTLPRDVDAVANGKDSLASSIRKHLERARQIRSEALEQRKSKAEQRKTEL